MKDVATLLIVFTLALGVVSLLLLVYPYVIYPRVLSLCPRRPVGNSIAAVPADGSRVALLFCAFNESSTAQEKVDNLRALKSRYPHLEILVYDDGSTDGCDQIYEKEPELLTLVRGTGRAGKAHGMKTLVSRTTREYLVFTDANVLLADDLIEQISNSFADREVGGVCGHLEYQYQSRSATEVIGSGYWAFDERLKRLESQTGNVMGGDGSIFAVRAELYPAYSDTVQDDFTVTMSVVFAGQRLVFEPLVVARERLVSDSRDEYRRKVRISARAYHTHLSMRSSVKKMRLFDRWKYFSHKVLRWYGAMFVVISGLAFAAAIILVNPAGYLIIAGLCLVFGVSVSLSRRARGVLEVPLALFATFHGVSLALRGRTFATWVPPESR